MAIRKILFILALLFIGFGYGAHLNKTFAGTCITSGVSPTFNLDLTSQGGACQFASSKPGVDAGTGTTNTANLVVTNGTLTVAVSTTIHVGKITIGASGIVSTVGTTCVGCALYWTDADGDTYAVDPAITAVSLTGGTGKVRSSSLASTTVFDCDDNNAAMMANATCYVDADQDTYTSGGAQSVCGASTTCNGTTWKAAANGADCNDGATTGSTVFTAHAQCYTDADGDTYTVGLAANTTCLNTASCATATKASASTADAAVTTYTAGRLRDAANGADCNDGATTGSTVFTAHAQCYTDADGDTYTAGLAANTTCLNTGDCTTATKASASTADAAVTTYTAGRLRNSATTNDCHDGDASYFPNNGSWYNDANDYNCSGSVERRYGAINCTDCTTGTGHAGKYDQVGGITTQTCGASGDLYNSLNWGCYEGTVCPNQFSSTVTQQCH